MRLTPHHVAISVTDLERSERFYEAFGFRRSTLWSAEDGTLSALTMTLGDFALEMFQSSEPAALPASARDVRTDLQVLGVKHLALRADDIHETLRELQAAGIAPEDAEIRRSRLGADVVFVADPDGILLEITQPVEDN